MVERKKVIRRYLLEGYVSAQKLVDEINKVAKQKVISLGEITFDIEIVEDYGNSSYPIAFLEYREFETEKEAEERGRREAEQRERALKWDREQYEKLKAKFEPK